ncbi:hypothetical protein FA95DRAFT_1500228 [Auriscalpium vulgare]|uniref:Uncharacterized protein n=1 Tax=Auriscalpium vulgare TaxID=40419 RepID=A0ACB8RDZ9_9AGAM|nr:hypothetical protein FA95DRAFT_1500228 [Auriscalpium vulgare]
MLCPRFPCAEASLKTGFQVHDTIVTIQEVNGLCHDFLICFLYSPDLPVNHALIRLYPQFNWRGELLVMRKCLRKYVTSMGGRVFDALAEEAVIGYAIYSILVNVLLIEDHSSGF